MLMLQELAFIQCLGILGSGLPPYLQYLLPDICFNSHIVRKIKTFFYGKKKELKKLSKQQVKQKAKLRIWWAVSFL